MNRFKHYYLGFIKESMKVLHHVEKWVDTYFKYCPRSKPNTLDVARADLIAHRGAHDNNQHIQENTIAAFEQALKVGCSGIEFDIHASADGVLMVNHDATLKRLWGHDVAINQLSAQDIHALTPLLPSLSEVVDRYGRRMHLFIELKAPFIATKALAETLKGLTPCVDYHLISLDETILPTLTQFPKESMLLVPVHNNVRKFCTLSLKLQYGGILGHYFLLNNRQIKQLLKAKQLVGVGFVDSKFSLYRELNRGLHVLFTNNAVSVAHSLQELRD